MPAYNFNIKRGATKVFTVRVDEDIVDIGDYNARMFLRSTVDAEPALELYSIGATENNSSLTILPESGSVRVYISAADTDLLLNDVYLYDMELYTDIDPYGQHDPEYVIRVVEGYITVSYNIIRQAAPDTGMTEY